MKTHLSVEALPLRGKSEVFYLDSQLFDINVPIPFPSDLGRDPRRVVGIVTYTAAMLLRPPGLSSDQLPTGVMLADFLLVCRDANGVFLIRDMPLVALLPGTGVDGVASRLKSFDRLPICLDQSYIYNTGASKPVVAIEMIYEA